MLCLIKGDTVFILYDVDIEELELDTLLEFVDKDGTNLFSQSIKEDSMFCVNKYVICLYWNNGFICFISSNEYIMVLGTSYHFYSEKYGFKLIVLKFIC